MKNENKYKGSFLSRNRISIIIVLILLWIGWGLYYNGYFKVIKEKAIAISDNYENDRIKKEKAKEYYGQYKLDSVYSTKAIILEKLFVGPGTKIDSYPVYNGTTVNEITTTSTTDEKFYLIYKNQNDKIYKIDNYKLWAQVEKGDSAIIYFKYKNGVFSKNLIFTNIKKL